MGPITFQLPSPEVPAQDKHLKGGALTFRGLDFFEVSLSFLGFGQQGRELEQSKKEEGLCFPVSGFGCQVTNSEALWL